MPPMKIHFISLTKKAALSSQISFFNSSSVLKVVVAHLVPTVVVCTQKLNF